MNMHRKPVPKALFITGIGTDVGKSYATGWLAKEIAATGKSVITQKLIQTGNRDVSEDIEIHRRIMGIPMQSVDLCRVTAPIILSYPASPHLAAKIDGIELDYGVASAATDTLLNKYDHVLIEGAGGLMVPLKERYLTIDYITGHKLPTVVVTNGRLGSISDTLLTLSALAAAGADVFAVIYNPYFDKDKTIADETLGYLAAYVQEKFPDTLFLSMPADRSGRPFFKVF